MTNERYKTDDITLCGNGAATMAKVLAGTGNMYINLCSLPFVLELVSLSVRRNWREVLVFSSHP